MADEPNAAPEPKAALRILAYLVEHPEAQDSIEGILQWWLLDRFLEDQISEVETELGKLVAEGLVEEVQGPDGHKRFRLHCGALERARALLDETRRSGS